LARIASRRRAAAAAGAGAWPDDDGAEISVVIVAVRWCGTLRRDNVHQPRRELTHIITRSSSTAINITRASAWLSSNGLRDIDEVDQRPARLVVRSQVYRLGL